MGKTILPSQSGQTLPLNHCFSALCLAWTASPRSYPKYLIKIAYNYASLKFDDYNLGDENLSGNHLPGVPQQQFTAGLQYDFLEDWGSALQTQYTGTLYADDANQTQIVDYFLANIRLWKSFDRLSFFGGINNLLDRAYFDNIRINAYGKRYYEPAPLRNFYLGMNITF